MIDNIIFWVFAVLAVGSAIAVVSHKSNIYAALFLVVVFVSNSAFFLLNNADFLAITQLLVYAVGLTIIILFSIMFTGDRPLPQESKPVATRTKVIYGIVLAYLATLLFRTVTYPFGALGMIKNHSGTAYERMLIEEGSTRLLGDTVFRFYGLPFELASILLLVAMIGAILISKKRFAEVSPGQTKYAIDLSSRAPDEAVLARRISLQDNTAADSPEETGEETDGGKRNPAPIS